MQESTIQTLYFEDLAVGMRETISKTVENEDVIGFAELSGDRNPIHLSEHFARKTQFGGRIVQTFNLRGSNMNRHSETSATAQEGTNREVLWDRKHPRRPRDGDVIVDPRAIEPHTRAACGTRG